MSTFRISSHEHEQSADIFRLLDQYELHQSMLFNKLGWLPSLGWFFAWVSRLGDGIFWYSLMTAIFLLGGRQGMLAAVQMALVALLGVALYKWLKNSLLRIRPYITHAEIRRLTAPLDYYSFPSGHTLHAVSFTIVSGVYYPALLWVTVPFTVLVALSRVILGLHYPSDVAAGALIGVLLASLSFSFL